MNLEYMLSRAYAGLNNADEALKHLQYAESLGFNFGYVYKNDDLFDTYRSLNKDWTDMQEKMKGYISLKIAGN